MMRWACSVLAVVGACAAAQPDPAALLKERDALVASVDRLLADGKPADAVAAARVALEKTRAARAAGHAEEADGLALLARAREAAGDFAAAVADRDAAVALRVQLHGPADWRTADAKRWAEYARLRQGLPPGKQKPLAAAEAKLTRFGPFLHAGKAAEAADLAAAAVETFKELLPADHWRIADGLFLRAMTELDRPDESEPTYRAVLAIRVKALGEDHPDTARARVNRGQPLHRLNRDADALAEYRAAFPVMARTLGDAHPDTATVALKLFVTYYRLGRYQEAKAAGAEMVRTAKAAHGPVSPETASRLEIYATGLTKLGDMSAAREAFGEALAAFRGLRPPHHLDAARVFTYLAETYPAVGPDRLAALEARRTCFRDAVAEARRDPAAPPGDVAYFLNLSGRASLSVAATKFTLRRPEKEREPDLRAARADLEAALALDRQARPPRPEQQALTLVFLAQVALSAGDRAETRRWYDLAAASVRALDRPPPLYAAHLHQGLGLVGRWIGDYPAAGRNLEAAVPLLVAAGPASRDRLSDVHSELGDLRADEGRLLDARKHFTLALETRPRAPGPDTLGEVLLLGHLARTELHLGNARAGMKQYEALLDRFRTSPGLDRQLLCEYELTVAMEYMSLGERRESRAHLDRMARTLADVAPPPHPGYAVLDAGYALLALAGSDIPTGRRLAARAVEGVRGAPEPYRGYLGWTLSVRLAAERLAGDFRAARDTLTATLAEEDKAERPRELYRLTLVTELGKSLTELGDYPAARARFAEAAAGYARAAGPESDMGLINLRASAHNEYLAGDSRRAAAEYTAALDRMVRQADRSAPVQSETAQLNRLADLHALAEEFAFVADGAEAYGRLLRVKGGVTVRQRVLRAARDPADPVARALADDLAAVSHRLLAATVSPPSPAVLPVLPGAGRPAGPAPPEAAAVQYLLTERDRLERLLADRNPAYQQAVTRPVPTPAAVRAALPPGAALVDFYHATDPKDVKANAVTLDLPRRLVVFVTRADRDGVTRIDLGNAAPVAAAVDRWRARYATDPPAKVEGDPGADLRRLVWEPVVKHLGGAKTVLVSPDGPLTALPFAALPGEKAGTFLIEDGFTFATVPVPQLLPDAAAARPAGGPGTMLLVGDVDFGPDDQGPRYARLRGTRAEVATIAGQHERAFGRGGAVKLERTDATRAAFLAAAPKHRFLHLATHGFFEGEGVKSALDPTARAGRGGLLAVPPDGLHPGFLSGVVFAGVNADPPGGLLTALEAADLDLKGVELAVLSACNTGRGKVAGGEGVLGLQRALQVAGVRTTVATLWAVDDRDAEAVTTGFYEQLWEKKLPPAAALRAAQLDQLRAVRRRNVGAAPAAAANPYHWAGFVLAGPGR